jgi:hypothetical protein
MSYQRKIICLDPGLCYSGAGSYVCEMSRLLKPGLALPQSPEGTVSCDSAAIEEVRTSGPSSPSGCVIAESGIRHSRNII